MIAHFLMVIYTGAVFLIAGAVLLEICRLLGKAYENKASASMVWRALHFAGAVVLFGYGCMVLFPGRALQTEHMSIGLPLVGTVVIVGALGYLDHVMGEREPPPWSVQAIRLFTLLGMDGLSRRLAFKLPPARLGDAPLAEDSRSRGVRLAVLSGAIAIIVTVAGFILTTSAATA